MTVNKSPLKKYLRLGLLILIAGLAGAYFIIAPPGNEVEKPGTHVENRLDFTLSALDGSEVSLAEYRGKKVVHLVFWATWCPSCRAEIPKLIQLYAAIGDRPYEILAINIGVNDSFNKVTLFQKQHQLPYKILYDFMGKVSDRYNVIGVPFNIIIDSEGNIIHRFSQLPDDPETYFNNLFPG